MTWKFWLGLLTGTAVLVLLLVLVPHAVLWFVGVYPVPAGTSPMYQLWSGFIPALAILSIVYPFVNCHEETCWRFGRYHIDGFRVCYVHHPDPEVRKHGVSLRHLHRVHEESQQDGINP